jgi:sugar lactone lactonase YvrE
MPLVCGPLSSGFNSVEQEPRFVALLQRIRQENPPKRNAVVALTIDEGDLGPEGIAWSNRLRTFYLGSIKRKIVAVSRSGEIRELVAPRAHGLGAVAGVRVDDAREELWVASSAFGPWRDGVVAGVFRFGLRDGALRGVHPIDTTGGAFVNDIALAPDGTGYATVTSTGALLRVRADVPAPEVFLPPGSLPDPNGIAVTPDGRYALVAGWHGIVRVDLATRQVMRLRQPSNVASGCIDGLYLFSA